MSSLAPADLTREWFLSHQRGNELGHWESSSRWEGAPQSSVGEWDADLAPRQPDLPSVDWEELLRDAPEIWDFYLKNSCLTHLLYHLHLTLDAAICSHAGMTDYQLVIQEALEAYLKTSPGLLDYFATIDEIILQLQERIAKPCFS